MKNIFIMLFAAILATGCASTQKVEQPKQKTVEQPKQKTEAEELCDNATEFASNLESVMNRQVSKSGMVVRATIEHCSEVKFNSFYFIYTLTLHEMGMTLPFAEAGFLMKLNRAPSGEFVPEGEPMIVFENAMPENMSLQRREMMQRKNRGSSI